MGSTTVAHGPATRANYADLICRFFPGVCAKGASLRTRPPRGATTFRSKEAAPINPVDLKTLEAHHGAWRSVSPGGAAVGGTTASQGMSKKTHGDSACRTPRRPGGDGDGSQCAVWIPVRSTPDAPSPAGGAGSPRESGGRRRLRTLRAGGDSSTCARRPTRRHAGSSNQPRRRRRAFHILSARPAFRQHCAAPGAQAAARPTALLRAREESPEIPKRMLLLATEVAGKLVKVDQIFAHGAPDSMNDSYEGQVIKNGTLAGSKSDRDAVMPRCWR